MTFEERVCKLRDEIFSAHKGRVSKTEAFDWASDVVMRQIKQEMRKGEKNGL